MFKLFLNPRHRHWRPRHLRAFHHMLWNALRRFDDDLVLAAGLHDALAVRCARRESDRAGVVAAALGRFVHIDTLVNNAGAAHAGPAEDETPEQLADLIAANLTGLFALPKLVGRHVLERAAGHRKHRLGLATISLDRYGPGRIRRVQSRRHGAHPLAWRWGRHGVRVNARIHGPPSRRGPYPQPRRLSSYARLNRTREVVVLPAQDYATVP